MTNPADTADKACRGPRRSRLGNTTRRPVRRLVLLFAATLMVGHFFAPPPAQANPPLLVAEAQRADKVVIEKGARRLSLFRNGKLLATYKVALGSAPSGDKRFEGDGRTPEGTYRIDRRNPRSIFHLSLGIDYPRPDQREKAKIEGRDPGGDIFIHGQPHKAKWIWALPYDWTAGCVSVSNTEIEQIWARVDIGTIVEIRR